MLVESLGSMGFTDDLISDNLNQEISEEFSNVSNEVNFEVI